MPDQVPEGVKTERSGVLQRIESLDSRDFRAFYIGSDAEVLCEEKREINGKKYWIGHTREYVKVAFLCRDSSYEEAENFQNRLITGKITGFLQNDVLFMECK